MSNIRREIIQTVNKAYITIDYNIHKDIKDIYKKDEFIQQSIFADNFLR